MIFLGIFALSGRARKDAPPVVGGRLPIFGHFFLFLKSPINLVGVRMDSTRIVLLASCAWPTTDAHTHRHTANTPTNQ